ncbi:MAG: hypothetical protein Q9167_002898 [Letrouitia subvulpina]
MGPRKRSKPNPPEEEVDSARPIAEGSWRQGSNKANPVTKVAKESISAATAKASEIFPTAAATTSKDTAGPLQSPAVRLSRSIGNSTRSLPLTSPTIEQRIPNGTLTENGKGAEIKSTHNDADQGSKLSAPTDVAQGRSNSNKEREQDPENHTENIVNQRTLETPADNDTSTWRGWFSRPSERKRHELHRKPEDPEIVAVPSTNDHKQEGDENNPPEKRRNSDPNPLPLDSSSSHQSRSWLASWVSKPLAKDEPNCGLQHDTSKTPQNAVDTLPSQKEDTPVVNESALAESQPSVPGKAPGWAFWSKSTSPQGKNINPTENVGELAMAQSTSPPKVENVAVDKLKTLQNNFRETPSTIDQALPQTPKGNLQKGHTIEGTKKLRQDQSNSTDTKNSKNSAPNSLLPLFHLTYSTVERTSLLESVSWLWPYKQPVNKKHVNRIQESPRIKRAIAIGVHGYFPAPLIRSVLGQPTGTSIRFADGAANAIQTWTESHGYSCEIEKVALEGEGKILERLDLLWNLLLNWIDNIRRADFVYVACHSQGVPVALMLIAKLIGFGCVQKSKIGVCAMAGVNLGPFIEYKSRWIGGSAGELFDFGRPDSQVSKEYRAALDVALKFGVRITFVGSMDDQLVSLEVSYASPKVGFVRKILTRSFSSVIDLWNN